MAQLLRLQKWFKAILRESERLDYVCLLRVPCLTSARHLAFSVLSAKSFRRTRYE